MTELRILRRCFGGAAIVFAFVFATMAPALLQAPIPHATPRFHAEPVGILLIAMRELMLLMPPFVALLNGFAWLALTNNHPSARRWAISACSSFLVMSVPFFVAALVVLPGTVGFAGVLAFALALSSIGITGITVLVRFNALGEHNLEPWTSPVTAAHS